MRGADWAAWCRWLSIAVSMTERCAATFGMRDEEMARRCAAGLLVPALELERQAEQRRTFEALL